MGALTDPESFAQTANAAQSSLGRPEAGKDKLDQSISDSRASIVLIRFVASLTW